MPQTKDYFEFFMDDLATRTAKKVLAELRANPLPQPRLLSVDEAAVVLGRTPGAVRQLLNSRILKNSSLDARVKIDIRDIEDLIQRSKEQ